MTVVKLKTGIKIVIGSAYLPYDYPKTLRSCGADRSHLIIDLDANTHHSTWGNTDIIIGGVFSENNLDIINLGYKMIGITIGSTSVSNFVNKWNVPVEESSDHRHKLTYKNPRKTNWEGYKIELGNKSDRTGFLIRHLIDLKITADQI